MIKTGIDVLFQEPDCDTRRLRRSVVVAVDADTVSIQFCAEPFAFTPDLEVLMYFHAKREFMQQMARVTEVIEPEGETDEPTTFVIEPLGDPISAENRQTYRVSTISADLKARVGDEQELDVQDLSATGFAVLASQELQLGQTVPVAIAHDDERCHGFASVQSIREFGPGRIRYGMRAIEEDPHTGDFLEVLQRISLSVQREQLQRSGGAAA